MHSSVHRYVTMGHKLRLNRLRFTKHFPIYVTCSHINPMQKVITIILVLLGRKLRFKGT